MRLFLRLALLAVLFLFAPEAFAETAAAPPPEPAGNPLLAAILPQLIDMASAALLAGGLWVLRTLNAWLKTKVHNDAAAGALGRLNDAVFTAVKEIQQTYVADLREAAKDGVVTPEELAKAKADAVAKAKSYIGPQGLALLGTVLGSNATTLIDSFIGGKIEAAVHDVKQMTATPAGTSPVGASAVPT